MNRLIQHLRTGLPDADLGDWTDGQLLERYVARRDADAFAALVRRHGPMVWGVCRRVIHGPQDAEDAFQATFLVLVRKAASVVPRQMVGNWLYGVACHTAAKARAVAARRQARERQVTEMPDREAVPPEPATDLQVVLDWELARLPDRYRSVILLCELEGKTRKEAARQLGVPEGTVAGRLARARAMLAKRLTRRGIASTGGSVAAALGHLAVSANAPAAVVSSTIQAASVFAAGPVPAGAIPAPVVALTEGVLKSMLLSKLKVALAVVVAAGILGIGVTGVAFHATAGQESKPKEPLEQPGKVASAPSGADAELKQLKAEVDRLRADVDALKKQLRGTESGGRPGAPPVEADKDKDKLVLRVYPVKDLIGATPADEQSPSISRIITNIVQPVTWSLQGGPGSIEYFAVGQSLVISQTAEVHTQVQALLEELLKAKVDNDRKKLDTDRKK